MNVLHATHPYYEEFFGVRRAAVRGARGMLVDCPEGYLPKNVKHDTQTDRALAPAEEASSGSSGNDEPVEPDLSDDDDDGLHPLKFWCPS